MGNLSINPTACDRLRGKPYNYRDVTPFPALHRAEREKKKEIEKKSIETRLEEKKKKAKTREPHQTC